MAESVPGSRSALAYIQGPANATLLSRDVQMYYEVEFGNHPLSSTFDLGPIGPFHLHPLARLKGVLWAVERLEGVHNFQVVLELCMHLPIAL